MRISLRGRKRERERGETKLFGQKPGIDANVSRIQHPRFPNLSLNEQSKLALIRPPSMLCHPRFFEQRLEAIQSKFSREESHPLG